MNTFVLSFAEKEVCHDRLPVNPIPFGPDWPFLDTARSCIFLVTVENQEIFFQEGGKETGNTSSCSLGANSTSCCTVLGCALPVL